MTNQIPPALTIEAMAQLTKLVVDAYYVTRLQMMENGGRALAELARQLLDGDVSDRPITILAGRKGCGGTGLVAARHLHNWGAWVQVVTTHPPEEYDRLPAFHLAALQAADIATTWAEDGWELPPSDLLIDALIGTGLVDSPHSAARELILLANSSQAPVLSLEMPSGVHPDTGEPASPHITATATLSLGAPTQGVRADGVQAICGVCYLADIGIPLAAYEKAEIEMPLLFATESIIRLT